MGQINQEYLDGRQAHQKYQLLDFVQIHMLYSNFGHFLPTGDRRAGP